MIRLNELSAALVADLAARAEVLEVEAHRLAGGAAVVDAGVHVVGSLEAGRLFAEICMGGLGRVSVRELRLGELTLPGVEVTVARPALGCMAAQYAGWAVNVPIGDGSKKYFAMGSGPARALYRGEPLFDDIDYADDSTEAVLTLEARKLPPDEVAEWLGAKCGVDVAHVHLVVAPTASLVGSVQIAARVVETGLHKMHEVGFDIECVRAGFGTCPLAPVAADDLTAIGRTNDAVLYGSRAWYTVDCDDAELEEVVPQLPSSASRDYGASFGELFQRYEGDFYKIDPLLFSPAEVALTNVRSGRTHRAGRVDADMIGATLLS